MTTIYCVKCRNKKEVASPQNFTMKNGKAALRAECPDCGRTMVKIGNK